MTQPVTDQLGPPFGGPEPMPKPPADPDAPDISDLSKTLPRLLQSYQEARLFVKSWSLFTIIDEVRVATETADLPARPTWKHAPISIITFPWTLLEPVRWFFRRENTPIGRWWYGFAITPLVSIWIDSHVVGKTRNLELALRQYRLKRATIDTPEMREVDRLIALCGYFTGNAPPYATISLFMRLVPLIGLASTLGLLPAYLRFEPQTLVQVAGQGLLIFSIVPIAVCVINPVFARFSFRWKRAIFTGGLVERRHGFDFGARFKGFPATNVFHLETEVHRQLGIRKKVSVPVDIILSPAPFFALSQTVSLIATLLTLRFTDLVIRGALLLQSLAPSLLVLALLWWLVWVVVRRYIRRVRLDLV